MTIRRFPMRCGLLLALVLASALPARAEEVWKAFVEKGKGESRDFTNPKELKDKDWLSVRYSEYGGYKSRVGVLVAEEKNAVPPKYKNELVKMIVGLSDRPKMVPNPQNHIEDLVRQALDSTHRFTLLERTTATDDLAAEQALADSGRVDSTTTPARVDSATAPARGKFIGAEYLVMATIIELNPEKETNEAKATGGSVNTEKNSGMFGDLGVKTRVAFCRLSLRVIKTETGEIVSDQTVDGQCLSTSLTGVTGFGLRSVGGLVRGKSKKAVPISDAMQTCANKAAYHVVMSLDETVWQGSVAGVEGKQITINGGTNVGLREGMTLTLLSKGEDVVDPETQEVVGVVTEEIGQVRVVAVQEKFATCEIVQGGESVKTGDLVRRDNPKP